MARRSSFLAGLERAARAAARAQREADAEERRHARDQLRNQREALRLKQVRDRLQQRQLYISRQDEAQAMTSEVTEQVESLRGILEAREHTTQEDIFRSLRHNDPPPVLTIPAPLGQALPAPQPDPYIRWVRRLAWWEKLFRYRARYERDLHSAEERYRADHAKWQQAEDARAAQVAALQKQFGQELGAYEEKVAQRDSEIQELRRRFENADPEAVATFFEIVLEKSVWPEEFPQECRVAYEPGAKQLVLDYELPTVSIVPTVAEYKYVKTKDAIEEKPRKPGETKEVYRDVVAATALRCVAECFASDEAHHVDVLTFSGFVNTTDPATGTSIWTCPHS